MCDLPRVVGPCDAVIPQWHYDRNTDQCYEFDYGGCLGNGNKFDNRHQCEKRCKKTFDVTSSPELIRFSTRVDEDGQSDICSAPVDPGPCSETVPAWYYNATSGTCSYFVYGGCSGNANRFQSEEQCERQCGTFKGQGKSLSVTYKVQPFTFGSNNSML